MARLVWCESGNHYYRATPGRGPTPASCPEHRQDRPSRTRWPGDLKTCFLLDRGWSFKKPVDQYLLDGTPWWRMPLSLAEACGLEPGDSRELAPHRPLLEQSLEVERRYDSFVGGAMGIALSNLKAEDGDVVFVTLRGDTYDLVLRRRSEIGTGDTLGLFLWNCGLDPHDSQCRSAPWDRLARVLGAGSGGRQQIRSRLEVRRDQRLLELIDDLERNGHDRGDSDPWPPGWQYSAPEGEGGDYFFLTGNDGSARVAMGVVDATGQPPAHFLVTEGGLCWMEQKTGFRADAIATMLRDAGRGWFPAAMRANWTSWIRTEHRARRAALADTRWSVRRDGAAWVGSEQHFERLTDALAHVAVDVPDPVTAPEGKAHAAYPRSSSAFQGIVERAVSRGLSEIRGDSRRGFRCLHADGSERTAVTLIDLLS